MMQAVIPRASTGTDRAALSRGPDQAGSTQLGPGPAITETVTTRLAAEFSGRPRAAVERCFLETWMCAEHLGLPVTESLVERITREHLHAMVKSVPPSRPL